MNFSFLFRSLFIIIISAGYTGKVLSSSYRSYVETIKRADTSIQESLKLLQQHYSSKTSNNLDHKQESSTNLNDNSEVEIVAVRPPVYGNIPLKKAPTSPRSSVTTYAHQANSFYKGPHFPIQPNNTNTVTENSSFKEKVAVAALNSIKNKASTNIYKSIPTQTETYCFTCNLQVPCLSALKKHYATIKHKRATEEQAKNSTPITSS